MWHGITKSEPTSNSHFFRLQDFVILALDTTNVTDTCRKHIGEYLNPESFKIQFFLLFKASISSSTSSLNLHLKD